MRFTSARSAALLRVLRIGSTALPVPVARQRSPDLIEEVLETLAGRFIWWR